MADTETVFAHNPPKYDRLVRSRTWVTDHDDFMVMASQHVECGDCGRHSVVNRMFHVGRCVCGGTEWGFHDGAL